MPEKVKPTCMDCGKELSMKAACICADCVRKSSDLEEISPERSAQDMMDEYGEISEDLGV